MTFSRFDSIVFGGPFVTMQLSVCVCGRREFFLIKNEKRNRRIIGYYFWILEILQPYEQNTRVSLVILLLPMIILFQEQKRVCDTHALTNEWNRKEGRKEIWRLDSNWLMSHHHVKEISISISIDKFCCEFKIDENSSIIFSMLYSFFMKFFHLRLTMWWFFFLSLILLIFHHHITSANMIIRWWWSSLLRIFSFWWWIFIVLNMMVVVWHILSTFFI